MANIILCDIDGTVANNDHRQHFLEGKKDWDGFTQPTPKIIETPSEVNGLNDMSISFSEEEDPSSDDTH